MALIGRLVVATVLAVLATVGAAVGPGVVLVVAFVIILMICLGGKKQTPPLILEVAARGLRRGTATCHSGRRRTRTLGALATAVIVSATSVLLLVVSRGTSTVAWATWTGQERGAIADVLGPRFQSIVYQLKGDKLPKNLLQAIDRGTAPDVAFLPQPGLLKTLARRGAIMPLSHIIGSPVSSTLASPSQDLAAVDDQRYGVFVKLGEKSTIWYNVRLFQSGGISRPPATYSELLADMATLKQHGITPFAMCGGSGWTLTDWFENVYLRTAGQERYNELAQHRIPWTDPSVTTAFTKLDAIFDDPDNMVGGFEGAASTAFPDCVGQVFGRNPKAAMLFEGDFVGAAIQALPGAHHLHADYDFLSFPSIDGPPSAVIYGGDVAVMLRDTPKAEELMRHLASLALRRGSIERSAYPDDIARSDPDTLSHALATNHAVFDMSDLTPPGFGGSVEAGEWVDLQNWLRHHDDLGILVKTQLKLEQDASRSYAT
jgi:alpha-glucoside transport system substrate-binding protein